MTHTDFPYLESNNEEYDANQGRDPLQDGGQSHGVAAFEDCQRW